MFLPRWSVKYPSVNPDLEKTALRSALSAGSFLPSRAFLQAVTAAATYSGRFIRPSILNDFIPSSESIGMLSISERSLRERS